VVAMVLQGASVQVDDYRRIARSKLQDIQVIRGPGKSRPSTFGAWA
jgi:hypothetical protein